MIVIFEKHQLKQTIHLLYPHCPPAHRCQVEVFGSA